MIFRSNSSLRRFSQNFERCVQITSNLSLKIVFEFMLCRDLKSNICGGGGPPPSRPVRPVSWERFTAFAMALQAVEIPLKRAGSSSRSGLAFETSSMNRVRVTPVCSHAAVIFGAAFGLAWKFSPVTLSPLTQGISCTTQDSTMC